MTILTIGPVNVLLRPLLLLFAVSLGLLPFALITLFLNAIIVLLATRLVPGFEVDTVWTAFLVALGPAARLGPGHLSPVRAALALRALRSMIGIPIHRGTLAPLGLHYHPWPYQTRPPLDFIAAARAIAPEVEVQLL